MKSGPRKARERAAVEALQTGHYSGLRANTLFQELPGLGCRLGKQQMKENRQQIQGEEGQVNRVGKGNTLFIPLSNGPRLGMEGPSESGSSSAQDASLQNASQHLTGSKRPGICTLRKLPGGPDSTRS